MRNIDKFRGCLIGGAAGDALGYAVEFKKADQIFAEYGPDGITEYDLHRGKAIVSDDTQMTLFTAAGLLFGTTRGMMRGMSGGYPVYISRSYLDWYLTQTKPYPLTDRAHYPTSWLVNVPELFHRRAPGNACLSACEKGADGTIEHPINDRRGCGGVMRVAPIGIYFVDSRLDILKADRLGAEAAALTHGHELGYLPAAALVHIIYRLAESDGITVSSAVQDSMKALQILFPDAVHLDELLSLMQKAMELASSDLDDLSAIRQVGEGWVGDEALAIAIYCAVKYQDDFDKALIAAVNHDGDSDSTGAVTGNILGARLGLKDIPEKYTRDLELKDVILAIADDLFSDCRMEEDGDFYDQVWDEKYIQCSYQPEPADTEKAEEAMYNKGNSIEIVQSDIAALKTDCVVNAANTRLAEGSGVCGAIFRAAGSEQLTAACARIGGCEEGSAVITPGFKMKAKYIIHAVGPHWHGGNRGERERLYSCYHAAMTLVQEKGCHSVGFPLISAGVFGYPLEEAWEVAIQAIRDYYKKNPSCDIHVVFAIRDPDKMKPGQAILDALPQTAEGETAAPEKYIFFWHEDEENGCFSQWYDAPFTIEGITYRSCEQYMMAKKALLFDDIKVYYAILAESSPKNCKKLGREIRNFDGKKWDACKEEIVYNANYAKFSQNSALKNELLATGSAVLVEASPYDSVWGIGMKATDFGANDPQKWKGQNLLGGILAKVRGELKGK